MTPERAGQVCDRLDQSLRGSEINLKSMANNIVVVIREEAWRSRRIRTGEIVECGSFLEMLTAPPLRGFGEDPDRVKALLKDDAEALTLFRAATTAPKGQPAKATQRNNDNVIIKPHQGNSRAYTLTRLQQHAPKLYEQVLAGTLSANAAAIQAGLRKQKTPLEQLQHWYRKASAAEKRSFEQWLCIPVVSTRRTRTTGTTE